MQVKLLPEAVEDLENLKQSPFNPEVRAVHEDHRGRSIDFYRLKLKDGNADHRIFFSIDGDLVKVAGIFHRDDCYSPIFYEELGERL